MPLAARKPQPSSPVETLLAMTDVVAEGFCALDSWHWISAEQILPFTVESSIATLQFFLADEIIVDSTINLAHFYITNISASIDLIIDVNQNFREELLIKEDIAIDPGDSTARIDAMEQDFAMSSINPAYYKEFTYNGEDLTGYNVYTSAAKTTQLFSVVLNFSGDLLTSKVITRISDSQILTVIFGYTGDQLTSQTRSIT